MKSGNKTLMILLGLLVVVGAAVALLPTGEQSTEVVEVVEPETAADDISSTFIINVDDEAPSFTVKMVDGSSVSLDDLRGKVVLLNFWATWCPPCQQELKRVQSDIIERFAGRDFVFLPISRGETKETVTAFLSDNSYTFAAGLDTDQSIYQKYAKNYIPRNYLINRHGTVIEASVGYEPEEFDALLQLIETTLNAR